ncbi:MAG: tetratricopeptide (TPR) repeat protein [Myxococcota bacterium]|jgi:tetratricopeptide (TPR) repeat protein
MAASMGDVMGLRVTLMEAAFEQPALVLVAQALILLDQGRDQAAAAVLEALDGLPEPVERIALVAHSQALIGLGEAGEAAAALQAALSERAEAEPDLLATLARAFFHSGELSLAETLLGAVLAVVPQHYGSRYGMGVIKLMQGYLDEAMKELRVAQQVNPRRREPYQAIARAWRLTGRPAEGAAELEALMGDNDLIASPGLARELVELYAASGDDEPRSRWLRYLEANAELGPGHRIELGRHWLALKQPGALRRLLIGLADEGDARIAGWLLAGMAEQLDGELEEALAYYQAAAQARPEMWFAQERTARLLLDAGAAPEHAAPFVAAAEAAAPQTPEVRLVCALHDCARGVSMGRHALVALAHHRGVRAEVRARAAAGLREHPG